MEKIHSSFHPSLSHSRLCSSFRVKLRQLAQSSGFTKFDGSQCFGANYRSFILKMPKRPGEIRCPLFCSKLQWQRNFSPASFNPLMHEGAIDTPHVAGIHEAVSRPHLVDLSDESQLGASSLEPSDTAFDTSELAALHPGPVWSRLIRKLSEANQYNRYLLREVQEQDRAIVECRSHISALELELGVLVNIAQEIARDGGKKGTRKINGRYIHSHLACRLEELQKSLLAQNVGIGHVQFRQIEFNWNGMAEDVTLMGSFDGWSQGESMSPEITGTFTRFSTTLKLRPGRYEIKFRIDGDWQLSPDLPTVGEGHMMNNLLIVK